MAQEKAEEPCCSSCEPKHVAVGNKNKKEKKEKASKRKDVKIFKIFLLVRKLLIFKPRMLKKKTWMRHHISQEVSYFFVINVKKWVIHYLDVHVNHMKIEIGMHLVVVMKIDPV